MKITEIIMSFIFLIGLIFKVMNWPGNLTFVGISLTVLSYYYLLFGFAIFNGIKLIKIFNKEKYININTIQIILSILLGLSISTLINGIMYKIQNWIIQIDLLLIGFILTLIILFLYFILLRNKNQKIIFVRSLIIMVIGIIVYFVF